MRKTTWRELLFAAVVVVFSCLLLSGGSRLIAAENVPFDAVCRAPVYASASFTCVPQQQENVSGAARAQECRAYALPYAQRKPVDAPSHLPETDANGNIICRMNYMRAVYQAFALGDGFA